MIKTCYRDPQIIRNAEIIAALTAGLARLAMRKRDYHWIDGESDFVRRMETMSKKPIKRGGMK